MNDIIITKKHLVEALKLFPDDAEINLLIDIRDVAREIKWRGHSDGFIRRKSFIIVRRANGIDFLSREDKNGT